MTTDVSSPPEKARISFHLIEVLCDQNFAFIFYDLWIDPFSVFKNLKNEILDGITRVISPS